MTTAEMQFRASELIGLIELAANDLRGLRDGARYDEDYKIEQHGKQLTLTNFEDARRLVVELQAAIDRLT